MKMKQLWKDALLSIIVLAIVILWVLVPSLVDWILY